MKFTVIKNEQEQTRDKIAESIIDTFISHGHELTNRMDDINFVINLTNVSNPRFFRRRSKSVFVISLVAGENNNGTIKSVCYTTLIKSLSNLLIYAVSKEPKINGSPDDFEIYFTTPEAGFYNLPFNSEEIYKRIVPIAGANFATENLFITDLPNKYWETTTVIEQLKHYGRVLDNLGVLPTPFPLREVLDEDALNHLYKIFGITGASYGNLSAREIIPELGETTFWMTGRGVDKSNLKKIGKDILLVKGFDFENGTSVISVPPDYERKARVSVDAVEHALIYKTFPDVGAIVHVHAWLDGVLCTHQNYPCGTVELAKEVVDLLKRTKNPSQSAVGLKNHGLTITGYSLDEIFKRIEGKLITEVKMFA